LLIAFIVLQSPFIHNYHYYPPVFLPHLLRFVSFSCTISLSLPLKPNRRHFNHTVGAMARMRITPSLFSRTPPEKILIQNKSYDYWKSLNESAFCIHSPGVAGWSYRLQEIVFLGCIPVLQTDYTHYPHHGVLDYSKFSISIRADDIGNLEKILLSVTMEERREKQLWLLKARDAFIYEIENPRRALQWHSGAAFFSMLSLHRKLATRF